MSDIYAIIKNKEEMEHLLKKLSDKGFTFPYREKEQEKIWGLPLDNSSNITEFFDYCIYKCCLLLLDSLKQNNELTDEIKLAIDLLRKLFFDKDFHIHLITSALYTVRYISSDSYMRINEYLYYNSQIDNGDVFLHENHLDYSIDQSEKYGLKVYTPNKTIKEKQTVDRDYYESINRLTEKVFNSHYKYLFDIDKVSNSSNYRYFIRLFIPTHALHLNKLLEERDNNNVSDSKKKPKKGNTKEFSRRIRKLRYTGIEIPGDNDKISIEDNCKILEKTIKQQLIWLTEDYKHITSLINKDSFYNDNKVNQFLFYYKLNLAFPIQFLLTIFNPIQKTEFNYKLIENINKIPDVSLRCNIYKCNYKYFLSNNHETDIHEPFYGALDKIFPIIEELFLAYIFIIHNKNYELLNTNLTMYMNNLDPSPSISNVLEKIQLANIPQYYSLDFYEGIHWSDYTKNKLTKDDEVLSGLYSYYIKNFFYYNDTLYDEQILEQYNQLINRIPFFASNKKEPKKEFSLLIHNKYELICIIAKILNDLFGK